MKHLIVLTGLVSVEKVQLTVELAQHFRDVTIIDNIARMRIDPVHLSGETLIRRGGDILPVLPELIDSISSEVVLFAVSETAYPEALFAALEDLQGVRITTIALIDLRTCDCFPAVRETMEQNATLAVYMPYDLKEVLCQLSA